MLEKAKQFYLKHSMNRIFASRTTPHLVFVNLLLISVENYMHSCIDSLLLLLLLLYSYFEPHLNSRCHILNYSKADTILSTETIAIYLTVYFISFCLAHNFNHTESVSMFEIVLNLPFATEVQVGKWLQLHGGPLLQFDYFW